jgi:O-antigen ligase
VSGTPLPADLLRGRGGSLGSTRDVSPAEFLTIGFLASVALGQIAKVPLISTEIKTAPVLLSDLIAALLCSWLLASALLAGRIRLDSSARYLGAFVACNILAIAVSTLKFGLDATAVVFSTLYLLRWSMYAGLYVFALTALKTSAAPRLIALAVGVCTVFAVFGIFQSIFLPNFAFIVYPDAIPYVDWDVQGNRLVSSFLDPNFAGAFILFGLLYAHARGATLNRQPYALLAVFWVALILTLSRSSILAAIVGLGIVTVRTGNFRKLFVPVLVLALVGWLAADKILSFAAQYQKLTVADPSALKRLAAWLLAWRIFADNPIIGVGYNTFGVVRGAYSGVTVGNAAFGTDGGLVYVAAVSGIVGVVLLGTVFWRLTRLGLRTYRNQYQPGNVRVLGLTLHAWIPSLILQSAASNSIFYPFVIGPLFLLGGLCAHQQAEGSAVA